METDKITKHLDHMERCLCNGPAPTWVTRIVKERIALIRKELARRT